jgi:excisionase family DNA binding protein
VTDTEIFLTIEHVAKTCNVHHRTVRRWIEEGKLVAIRLPLGQKNIRIRPSDLSVFMQTWISCNLR